MLTDVSKQHASEHMVSQQGPVRDGCDKGPSEFSGQNRTHGGVMSDTGEYIETNPSDLKVQVRVKNVLIHYFQLL